jgi:pimeloyl-ACP methyl ester carboxylesterase
MVPVTNVDVLRDRFPHASVRIVPDAGHGVVSQDRTAVVDAVRDLLGQ